MHTRISRFPLAILMFFYFSHSIFASCPTNQVINISTQGQLNPGQTVEVCMELDFFISDFIPNKGCEWLQGVVPVFGDCWDSASFNGSNASISAPNNGGGTWDWYDECEVIYGLNAPFLPSTNWGTYTNASGTLTLCNLNDSNIPFCSALTAGDCLPGGFYFSGVDPFGSPGNDHPNQSFGDGEGCGQTVGPFSFCFDLTTVDSDVEGIENCSIAFKTFTDVEIGIWSGATSAGSCEEEEEFTIQSFNFFGVALPIQLTEFNGSVNKQTGLLRWKTENENNFSHFELEYKTGNQDFTFLAKINSSAENVNSATNYSFEHNNKSTRGTTYYRLKMFDRGGEVRYSDVVALTYKADSPIQITPVPAVDHIVVQHPAGLERLEIFNAVGKLVFTAKIEASSISTTIQLDEYDRGIYFLRYHSKLEEQTHKFVVNNL